MKIILTSYIIFYIYTYIYSLYVGKLMEIIYKTYMYTCIYYDGPLAVINNLINQYYVSAQNI